MHKNVVNKITHTKMSLMNNTNDNVLNKKTSTKISLIKKSYNRMSLIKQHLPKCL